MSNRKKIVHEKSFQMKFPINFCQILFRHFVAQVGNKNKSNSINGRQICVNGGIRNSNGFLKQTLCSGFQEKNLSKICQSFCCQNISYLFFKLIFKNPFQSNNWLSKFQISPGKYETSDRKFRLVKLGHLSDYFGEDNHDLSL